MQAQNIVISVVKTVFDGDVRRFNLQNSTYDALVSTIQQLYPELSVADFSVKFRDEDGDLITISSNAELSAALTSANEQGLKALKLMISKGGAPAADFIEVATPPLAVSVPASPVPASPKSQAEPVPAAPVSEPSKPEQAAEADAKAEAQPEAEAKHGRCGRGRHGHGPHGHGCRRYKKLVKHLLSDAQVQAVLPDLVKALSALIGDGERPVPLTAQQVVDVLLSFPAIKQHEAVQALLPELPNLLPRLEEWATKKNEFMANLDEATWNWVKSMVPLVPGLVAQLGPQLPMLVKQAFRVCRMLKHGMHPGTHGPFAGPFGGAFPRCPGFFRRFFHGPGPHPGPHGPHGPHHGPFHGPAGHVSVMSDDASCDSCKAKPLTGTRYKCFRCRIILCETCEAKNEHPSDHALLKVRPEAIKPTGPKDVHEGVQCDGCGVLPIKGIRYKCTVCHDYDLCSACEAKNSHAADHPLVKMREVRQHHCFRGFHGFGGHGHHGSFGRFGFGAGRCGRFGRRPENAAAEATPAPGVESKQPAEDVKTPVNESKPAVPKAPAPQYEAAFVRDVTIPDGTVVHPGAELVKVWELRNTGQVAWPVGTKLIFLRGDRELSAQEEFLVPAAGPGQTAEASAVIIAPRKAGRYGAYFRLADSNREVVFGPRIWVDIAVPEVLPEPIKPISQPATPVPVNGATKFPEQLKVLNDMGFKNAELNEYLLASNDGNVQKVAHFLLEKMYGQR